MIVYDTTVINEPVIARFETHGVSNRQYWAENIAKSIVRRLGAKDFYISIYMLAIKHTRGRTNFCGKMNCVPNIEFGKTIAKARLLKKYTELEERVYKEFLLQVVNLPCVRDLSHSYIQTVRKLITIQNNISDFNKMQQILNQRKDELLR